MFGIPLCQRDNSLLTVIDIQPRLAAVMAEADRQRVIRNSAILSQAAARLGVPQLVTEQNPHGLGNTDPELAAQLAGAPPVVEKTCFSCLASNDYRDAVAAHHRQQVILSGMETHICVLQTALELHHDGYQVYVVEDAVCSRSEGNYRNALARMRQAGIIITNTESVLFEWLRDASDPHFKALLALIV